MRAFPLPRAHRSVPASAYALCRRLAPAPLTHVTKQPSAKRERLTPAAGRAANAHASTPNVASDDASDAATVAPKPTGRGAGKRSDRGRGATLEGNEVDLASDGESEFSEPEFPMQVLPQRASLCHISAVAAPHRCVGPHLLSLNVPDVHFRHFFQQVRSSYVSGPKMPSDPTDEMPPAHVVAEPFAEVRAPRLTAPAWRMQSPTSFCP